MPTRIVETVAYVVLCPDDPPGLEGHGFTFTNGRGKERWCIRMPAASAYVST